MFRNFKEVAEQAKKLGKITISVAVAQDHAVLEGVKAAYDYGIIDAILVGDADEIRRLSRDVGLPEDIQIVNEPDHDAAALAATSLVRNKKAQVLMKGLVNTSDFLRAVLNKEQGLRSGRLLNHLMGFEIPGEKKLVFHTDGGMNVCPNLEQKKEILINSVEALQRMGIDTPKVAVLTANEQVNPKIPATVDAAALVEWSKTPGAPRCIVEGPIAMDVALSPEAAKHKNIDSKISGNADLFLVPSIEAGNFIGKTLVYYAKAQVGGLVLGATSPIVLVSRSDTAESKFNAIALSCLMADRT